MRGRDTLRMVIMEDVLNHKDQTAMSTEDPMACLDQIAIIMAMESTTTLTMVTIRTEHVTHERRPNRDLTMQSTKELGTSLHTRQ